MIDFAGRTWQFKWHEAHKQLISFSAPTGAKAWGGTKTDAWLQSGSDWSTCRSETNTTGDVYVQGGRRLYVHHNTNGWVKEVGDGLGVIGRFQRDRHGQITF